MRVFSFQRRRGDVAVRVPDGADRAGDRLPVRAGAGHADGRHGGHGRRGLQRHPHQGRRATGERAQGRKELSTEYSCRIINYQFQVNKICDPDHFCHPVEYNVNESIVKVTTVVFDKTGTLTHGRPTVASVCVFVEERVLSLGGNSIEMLTFGKLWAPFWGLFAIF